MAGLLPSELGVLAGNCTLSDGVVGGGVVCGEGFRWFRRSSSLQLGVIRFDVPATSEECIRWWCSDGAAAVAGNAHEFLLHGTLHSL